MIGAVVLAAGAGRRLGGVAKALLRAPGGSSFLETIASSARAAGAREIVAVTGGPHRAVTEAEAARLGLAVAVNPDASRGMASSVEIGFSFALAAFAAPAALLWPVDHARATPASVAGLVDRGGPDRVIVPVYAGRGGHPALVGRALWGQLAGCASASQGARSVLRANADRVVRVDTHDAGVVGDVDTPADRA